MKKGYYFLTLITACILMWNVQVYAKLEVEGTIFAELIYDPKNFDPSIPRTSPWRSGDQGGIFLPGYYVGNFTKVNLNLRVSDNIVDAFVPLTISINPDARYQWQPYLITEDYLNIPYYLFMKAPIFTFSASSKPVGDKQYGFTGFRDPLGTIRRPNSLQPYLTLKVDAILPSGYSGTAYVMFDQLVEGIPLWESIPKSIARELLDGRELGEYAFVDELAQYSLVAATKTGEKVSIESFWGKKNVENPIFRFKNDDGSLSPGAIFTRWGNEKNNYGVNLTYNPTHKLEIKTAVVGSNARWYKYDSTRVTQDYGNYWNRWFPSENKGEVSGNAGLLGVNWKWSDGSILVDYVIAEPDFQAVGAVQDQFFSQTILAPRSETEVVLEPKTHLIYDPIGSLAGREINSSPVVDYLGRKKIGFTFMRKGLLGNLPVVLTIKSQEIVSLDEQAKRGYDPKSGIYWLDDQRSVVASLGYCGKMSDWKFEGKNYKFLSGNDYSRTLKLSTCQKWGELVFNNSIEKTWRLVEAAAEGPKGAVSKYFLSVGNKRTNQLQYMLSLDIRCGNYDYDLLNPIRDQVVFPYSYSSLCAYVRKEQHFNMKSGDGKLTLAGEFIKNQTDLDNTLLGSCIIGYLEGIVPVNKNLKYVSTNVLVHGSDSSVFPSSRIKSVIHNEFRFSVFGDNVLRLGHTNVGKEHNNSFASLELPLGNGYLGVSLGRGAAPIYKESTNLPGTMGREDFFEQDYVPTQLLSNRPWAIWENDNFNALWQNQLRSTKDTWAGYFRIVYRYSF